MEKIINIEPIMPIANKIKMTSRDIFLLGGQGSGKTTTLKALNNWPYQLIDISIYPEEFIQFPDKKIFTLYYITLIVKKIMTYFMEQENPIIYMPEFNNLYLVVTDLLEKMQILYMVQNYKLDILNSYLSNPLLLLDNLWRILNKSSKINQSHILMIDDFDTIGHASKEFQQVVYNSLKDYFRFIITVSDEDVLNNYEALQKEGAVIFINYNQDIKLVQSILYDFIPLFLNDNLVQLLITLSKGNISLMKSAVIRLVCYLQDDYEKIIRAYFQERLEMEIPSKKRKLYI